MNYISQLNGFRDKRKLQPLNAAEIAVYIALLEYANSLCWPGSFTVSNGVMQSLAGVSAKVLHNARKTLVREGYLHYFKGCPGRAGRYEIPVLQPRVQRKSGGKARAPAVVPATAQSEAAGATLPKENEKPNKTHPIQEEEEWGEYVEMRKSIHMPLVGAAAGLALQQLQQLAPENLAVQKQILHQSASLCWKGLYPLSKAKGERAAQKHIPEEEDFLLNCAYIPLRRQE